MMVIMKTRIIEDNHHRMTRQPSYIGISAVSIARNEAVSNVHTSVGELAQNANNIFRELVPNYVNVRVGGVEQGLLNEFTENQMKL